VLDQVSDKINSGINTTSRAQLDRVDENLIKSALKKMKSNKRDAVFDTVSDCYINGPPELVSHLTKLVRMYIAVSHQLRFGRSWAVTTKLNWSCLNHFPCSNACSNCFFGLASACASSCFAHAGGGKR
jgi:hypothetical protein